MGETRYKRVGRKTKSHVHVSNIRGGFRINSKRFSVQRLRSRFIFLLNFFNRLKSSYARALRSVKKGCCGGGGGDGVVLKRNGSSSSRKALVALRDNTTNVNFGAQQQQQYYYDCSRLRSFGRSNSFYAEAIADCLEFIKRSSVSVDQ